MTAKSIYPKSVQPGKPKLGPRLNGWSIFSLGELLEVKSVPVTMEDTKEYRLVTAKRSRGGIIIREKKYGIDIKVKSQFKISEGDFLVSRRQIVHGGCGIVPSNLEGAIVSNEYLVLKAKKEKLLQSYLGWLSHTIYFQQTCFHASIGVHVEKMVFKPDWWLRFKFYIPPLVEQKKLIKILATWGFAVEKTIEVITTKKLLKKGLIQQLLTGRQRLPEFTKPWKELKLEQIGKLVSGGTPTTKNKNFWRGEIPWVSSSDLSEGNLNFINKQKFITEEAVKKSATNLIPKGSILIVSRVGVGKVAVSDCDLCTSQDFQSFIVQSTEFSAIYIAYQIVRLTKQLLEYNQGTAIKGILKKDLANLTIPQPCLQEQKKISSILSVIDGEIENLEKLLALYQTQKKGLMQQLLTGKRRVNVDRTIEQLSLDLES